MAQQTTHASDLPVILVTPTGVIAEDKAQGVTAPGELGQFEVRPGHVPYLTKLKPGVLVLHHAGKARVFAIGSGLLEVDTTGHIRILSERGVPSDDIDLESARAEVEATEPLLKDWKQPLDGEWAILKNRYDWAQAQVEAKHRARA
jgi:F-type H+-transporting ATPase subunit epsilon